MNEQKSYRIRTNVGDNPNVLNVKLEQHFDTFEILSLKISQINTYKLYESNYGVIVGRVLANKGFGIPNAKVSVFIESDDTDTIEQRIIYPYKNITDINNDLIRYNLLPKEVDNECYQPVGNFPTKRLLLDNNDLIEVFDKYWKYTTTTNQSGDYMLFGIPTGNQQIHVDIDLSDIGLLSQRPRDMIYKGYNSNLFESPNKFKQSTNLDSLSQIYSQNIGVNVYPFWGDTSDNPDNIAITRCDIQIQYEFEPTCVFMGSIITDTGSNAIGKNCAGTDNVGRMSDLISGEGTIEMIRKTHDGRVEEFSIKGNRLIDGDGVWCYQIPMNLDYVMTDEFGNLVPTEDSSKGIPTRTRVRFRISMDEAISDNTARKRCKYLVPNNPRMTDDYPIFSDTKYANYEFGTSTREEDYRDLFWNKVYSVKNYIPRLQKNNSITNRKHTGIKLINYYGDNNPMPYNLLTIKLSFTYRLICVITKIIIYLITFLNWVISAIGFLPCELATWCLPKLPLIGKLCLFEWVKPAIPKCIRLSSEFCDDGINKNTYYPGCFGCVWQITEENHNNENRGLSPEDVTYATNKEGQLITCVETSLAQDNEAASFIFANDWINGCLYAPLWYRKITPKKSFLFGLFSKKAKDEWCSSDRSFGSLKLFQSCAVRRSGDFVVPKHCGDECHKETRNVTIDKGVIVTKQTILGQTVYYYKSVEYSDSAQDVTLLFATDIILLGSLNDCDINGIPQFFKSLEPTTYNMPSTILFTDNEVTQKEDSNGNITYELNSDVEMTGCDWGNINTNQECGSSDDGDSGLFYGIGCSSINLKEKSCINLSRICEFGVSLDEAKSIPNLNKLEGSDNEEETYDLLIPDGFISYDELYNFNERSMFATMNGNNLRVKDNVNTGLPEYDFNYMYIDNFDGSLRALMEDRQRSCDKTYRNNYKLENKSEDYIKFRMGEKPYFYDADRRIPRYENSFYFYFGLKSGKTALEKFNSQFFSVCKNDSGGNFMAGIIYNANSWCLDKDENKRNGYITIDLTGITMPYSITLTKQNVADSTIPGNYYEFLNLSMEKVYIGLKHNITNPTDASRLDSFEPISGDENNNITISNGVWNIMFTDSEGNSSGSIINFVDEYLTYKIDVEVFKQPNNVLFTNYNSYQSIANNKDGFKINENNTTEDEQFWTRDLGGMIIIHDIFYMRNELKNEFIITVEPVDVTQFDDYTIPYNGLKIKNNRVVSGYGFLDIKTFNNTNAFYIGVPKGGVSYKVTVQQTCNGVESGNYVSRVIYVSEPTPYEMFINDVNYELIKNFKHGWTADASRGQINNLKGWDKISEIGVKLLTYESTDEDIQYTVNKLQYSNDGVSYYNWTKEYLYVKDYNYDNYMSNKEDIELKSILIDTLNIYIQKRIDLVKTMKEGFYISCPNDTKTINISVRTDDYPIRCRLNYIQEEALEDAESTHTIIDGNYYNGVDVNSITDIKIPTITNIDNELYGNKTNGYYKDTICFAKDNSTNKFKKPYFVGVINSTEKTIPSELKLKGFEDGDLTKMFGFHMIDKTLRINFTSWSYIKDIPYYWPNGFSNEDEVRDGTLINMNGLFGGYAYNGMSSEVNTKYCKYEKQTVNNTPIIIHTQTFYEDGTPNEDAIPTKRIIIGYNEDFNSREYKKYCLEENDNNSYYVPLSNRTINLNIDDGSCNISENLHANMYLRLNTNSINDVKNNSRVLSLSTTNGDEDMTYYIIRWNSQNNNYPLNNIIYSDNKYIFNANSYNDYGIMKYGLKHVDYLNMSDNSAKSQIENRDTAELIESSGYGTTGGFWNLSNGSYFVMALTSNNCATLSPVYDFSDVEVMCSLGIIETENQDGTTENSYALRVQIVNSETHYYIRNFSFKGEISINISSTVINGIKDIQKSSSDYIKVNTLPENGDNENLYYIEKDGEYIIYAYKDAWTAGEETTEVPEGIELDFSDNKKYYLENVNTNDGTPKYITLETDMYDTVIVSESNIEPDETYTKITEDCYYAIITPVTDEDTGETVEVKTYIPYVFTKWEIIETTKNDPSLPHYQKTIDFVITKDQYNFIQRYISNFFTRMLIVKNTSFYLTDYTGLRHSCIINYKT